LAEQTSSSDINRTNTETRESSDLGPVFRAPLPVVPAVRRNTNCVEESASSASEADASSALRNLTTKLKLAVVKLRREESDENMNELDKYLRLLSDVLGKV
jgi:hypothetical protein